MAESNQQPRQRGSVIEDAVTAFVNGEVFDGWENVSVRFNLTSISGRFTLSLFDRFLQTGSEWAIKPGSLIHLHIGQDPVFTGYVDSLNSSFDQAQRAISVSGRSKTGDLVDSSHVGEMEFTNLKLDKLIERIVEKFNVRVLSAVSDLGKPFEKFAVKQNETVFDAIKRAALMRGFLLVSDVNGNLVITRKAQTFSGTSLVQGENIKSASVRFDNSNRFSEYIVRSQSPGNDFKFGKNASESEGRAEDKGILRYRPTIVMAEVGADNGSSEERAQWEATLRAAEAMKVNCKVQGWRKADGSLWLPNQLVRFRSPFLSVDSQLLVSSVELNRGYSSGTTANLELIRPDAFELKKIIPEENDPLSNL